MKRSRGEWTPKRRKAHGAAVKAMWARKRKDGTAARRRPYVRRPFLAIYEECFEALRRRQWQFLGVQRELSAYAAGDDSYEEVAGMSAQNAVKLDIAIQAMRAVISEESGRMSSR